MLTDRRDVPHTPFGRLKPPNGLGGGGRHKNTPTMYAIMFLEVFIHKNNLFCDYKSPSTVRGQFKDILGHSCLKCIFRADIVHSIVDGFKKCYYCGNDWMACTMGQCTVLWCSETPLRQYIMPVYETI